MKKLLVATCLVVCFAAAHGQSVSIQIVSDKCNPQAQTVPAYIDAAWQGPLNGKTCTVHAQLYGALRGCNDQGCHVWGCVTSTMLEDNITLPGHACDCWDDWTAASHLTVNNTCTPTSTQFNEDYFCD